MRPIDILSELNKLNGHHYMLVMKILDKKSYIFDNSKMPSQVVALETGENMIIENVMNVKGNSFYEEILKVMSCYFHNFQNS
jgi:hypothetical protein